MTRNFERLANYQRNNPFRTPAWRYERVKWCLSQSPYARSSKADDKTTRLFRTFLMRWLSAAGAERENLYHKAPDLYYANELFQRKFQTQTRQTCLIEARLLARTPVDEIARLAGTTPQAIVYYESLFFNVTPYLENRDWVTSSVLAPALSESVYSPHLNSKGNQVLPLVHPFYDGSLKYFAYFAGPLAVDYFISGFHPSDSAPTADGYEAWLNKHWSRTLKRRSVEAATKMEVTRYDIMQLFSIHSDLIKTEKITEGAGGASREHEAAIVDALQSVPFLFGEDAERDMAKRGMLSESGADRRDREVLALAYGGREPDSEVLDEFPSLVKA